MITKVVNKYYLSVCIIIISIININAQYLWFETETETYNIAPVDTYTGEFSTVDVINPDINDANTNVSKFEREEGLRAYVDFSLTKPINDLTNYQVVVKAYLDIPTEDIDFINKRLRVYLKSSQVTTSTYKQLVFLKGQTWQTFTFDFSGVEISDDVLNVGGFNEVSIAFANNTETQPAKTYYIDTISGSTSQEEEEEGERGEQVADWLQGSWGATFPVYGGDVLDRAIEDNGYDYIGGAQELVDNLPQAGHVITNLSYFAHSHYFLLSKNNNVDVATEIHSSLVPTDNDELIFDVLDIFKAADKKIILYISTNYLEGADEEVQEAWIAYYTENFEGDEYAAYENLCEGFIEQVKDYADGYWLDTTGLLIQDDKLEGFIEMIKTTDSGAAVCANNTKNYFVDDSNNLIYVESDGTDDDDDTTYKIVKHEPFNDLEDFTNGHVTPVGLGAPPNSFGYEEYTIPNMIENPWFKYSEKYTLKHGWFPIREAWHVPQLDLVFETEQAYRFVKKIIDGGAAITFANTTTWTGDRAGYMMSDEMEIMKEINDRLSMTNIPDYEPYVRPEGAFLVGEEVLLSSKIIDQPIFSCYPNPVVDKLNIQRISTDITYVNIMSVLGDIRLSIIWKDDLLTKEINLSSLEGGVYFATISNSNGFTITKKIIITK